MADEDDIAGLRARLVLVERRLADSPNRRAYTGEGLEELLGHGWVDAIHPDDRAYGERQWAEATAAQGFVNAEFRLRAPDGGWRWTNVRAAPVRDDAGRIRKWSGMNIDIHARKSAEAALSASEEKYRFRFSNRRYEEWFGQKREEIDGRHARDLLGEAAYERLRPYAEAALSGHRQLFEEAIPFEGIGTRHVRTELVPDMRGDGSVAGYYALIVDISERKRMEEALRENGARLRNAAEVAKFGLWDWDIRTDTVVWSDDHFRMEEYEVGEVVSSYRAWADRVHPDDLAATEATISAARDTRIEYHHEFRSLYPDGSVHWHLARGRFFYDGEGLPIRMIGAMLDTTHRREGEE